jgi:hypothetical protein
MGPWGHLLPHESAHDPVDFLALALRWWEHWLGGVPTGVMDEPAVTLHLAGTPPRWLGFRTWPPPATELLLAARGDTTLSPATTPAPPGSSATTRAPLDGNRATPARPDGSGTTPAPADGVPAAPAADGGRESGARAIARHEPDATVGALRGLPGLGLGEQFPPQDQHDDDMRSVAVTSAPLPAGLVVGGRPRVRITTAGAGAVGRLVVRLTEVDAEGRSVLITAGVLCDPGGGDRHVVTLRPIVHAVTAGHRLRVAVGDADFPRLMPLVRPARFDVTAIEVSLPTLAEAAGTPVDLPELPPPPVAGAPPATGLRITRDQQAEEIEVVVDNRVTDHRGPGGQHYRLRGELRARVRRAEPETAVTTGTQVAEVRLSTGEVVTASATVLCTQTALRARAELTANGAVLFARSWEAGLVPDSPRA